MSFESNTSAPTPTFEAECANDSVAGSLDLAGLTPELDDSDLQSVKAFLAGQMPEREKGQFIKRLRADQEFRLGVIQTRRQAMLSADSEYPEEVRTPLSHFRSFLMNCPGSTYVAGIEFRRGMAEERQQRIARTSKLLEELFEAGGYEDIALENTWRLAYDANVLAGISPSNYPGSDSALGSFLGAMVAVRESKRGSWTDKPYNFIEPIS